jgi:c-di-GMP-related signal transduction protein
MTSTVPSAFIPLESTDSPPVRVSNLIGRQPIVDLARAVVAYELFDRSTEGNGHNTSSDISMLFNAMSDTGSELGIETKTIFINRTHQSLMDGHLDLVRPERIVIEVGPVAAHDSAGIEALLPTLLELRAHGYKLAFNHTVLATAYKSWQPLAAYVKLDMTAIKPDLIKPIVAAVKARTKAQLVAEKIETAELFKLASEQDIALFQGYWIAHPKVVKVKVVAPSQASVLQLFSLVRKQAETDEIEALLKRDAMLGFNLMRLINSAGFGMTREVTSFRHAVMLIGMKRLFRWTALLLTVSRTNGAAAVVGTTAVVRGRMMELLGAGTLSQEDCDSAFVVGIFSLLDEMLCVPMAQALELLALPESLSEAILHGSGVLGRMLALTKAAEGGDDATFSQVAQELHYTNHHVNTAHLESLVWADSLSL